MIRPALKRTYRAFFACVLCAAVLVSRSALAQDSPEGLILRAQKLYSGQETSLSNLETIRDILNHIVTEHPSSDLAVSIILQENVNGIDVIDLDRRLTQSASTKVNASQSAQLECIKEAIAKPPRQIIVLGVEIGPKGQVLSIPRLRVPEAPDAAARADFFSVVAALDACSPFSSNLLNQNVEVQVDVGGRVSIQPIISKNIGIQSEAQSQPSIESNLGSPSPKDAEAALSLKKQKIREIQARLLLSGHNPKGVDGILGSGTRAAIRSWQAQKGLTETGYLSMPLLQALQSETSSSYPIWLKEQKAVRTKKQQRKSQPTRSRLPKGWFRDRAGKYCRKVQFGLTMCQPYPP